MFGFDKKNNEQIMNNLNKWEETFEIEGMKFTVKCNDIGGTTFRFEVYNESDEPVANTTVRVDKVPSIEEFIEEIAKPTVKKLMKVLVEDFDSAGFMGLIAPKMHKKSEYNGKKNRVILRSKWQTFVADKIRKAADEGEFEVNISRYMPGDNAFEGDYDREIMLDETTKILQKRGFKVYIRENDNNPTAFIMKISW